MKIRLWQAWILTLFLGFIWLVIIDNFNIEVVP